MLVEGAEATAQLRAEQEAQRGEAERTAKEEAQLAAAKEARRSVDEETRRKAADAHGSAEGEAQHRAAEETVPRGAEPSHAQPVLRKVVGIGGIIGVTALAVFFLGRSPDAPVASVTPPASSSPISPISPSASKPVRNEMSKDPLADAIQAELYMNKTAVAARKSASNFLSANALHREFHNYPVDASNRYVGKTVTLEGLRGDMILTSDGVQAAVHIVDGSQSNALILVFSDRNQLKDINQGERFRFKCTVGKYEYSIVWMDDCSIVR